MDFRCVVLKKWIVKVMSVTIFNFLSYSFLFSTPSTLAANVSIIIIKRIVVQPQVKRKILKHDNVSLLWKVQH